MQTLVLLVSSLRMLSVFLLAVCWRVDNWLPTWECSLQYNLEETWELTWNKESKMSILLLRIFTVITSLLFVFIIIIFCPFLCLQTIYVKCGFVNCTLIKAGTESLILGLYLLQKHLPLKLININFLHECFAIELNIK